MYTEQVRVKRNLYSRQYYKENREVILEQKREYGRNRKEEVKKRDRERSREWQHREAKKRRLEVVGLLGSRCAFCGKTRGVLILHEIYGRSHSIDAYKLVLRGSKDFVLLHYLCHRAVHLMLEHLGLAWKEIESLKGECKNV